MNRLLSFPRSVWRNSHNHTDLPRLLTYTTTFKCNARCIMCDSWKKDSRDDLSLLEINAILDQLPQMDMVRITGGEPFLRPDLIDIVHQVQEKLKPLVVHITTNGFLTDRIVRFCENRDKKIPLFLLLSVDGMKEKHNYIRGTNKAWDRVMQTIKRLSPIRKNLKLKMVINQTIIDEEGIDEFTRLRKYLGLFDIQINAVLAYETSAIYNRQQDMNLAPSESGQYGTFGEFSPRQIDQLVKVLDQDLKKSNFPNRLVKRYYLRGIQERVVTGTSFPNPKCVALNSHIRIMPDGQVPICQFNTTPVGDFRKQSFEDMWFGDGMKDHRHWVSHCPGCWAECEVLPNAVYSGNIFKHLFIQHRKISNTVEYATKNGR